MSASDKPDTSSSNALDRDNPPSQHGMSERRAAGAKQSGGGLRIIPPLILGMLLGALGAYWMPKLAEKWGAEQTDWVPSEFYSRCDWCYVKADDSGWSTGPVGGFDDLDVLLGQVNMPEEEIVIPILPTVYWPSMADELYYDAIWESDIKEGDKVLVIGTGSGADAWVASLKSKTVVHIVEINPMAILNAKTTARFADFQIRPILGDITTVELPDDFRDFDFVLWNMPFLGDWGTVEETNLHDGDEGGTLQAFLDLLPSLLKKGGQAIVLNVPEAGQFITGPNVTTKTDGNYTLFVIPNL